MCELCDERACTVLEEGVLWLLRWAGGGAASSVIPTG